jgi:hypothetical protein
MTVRLMALAGKLDMLSKDRDFKKFLKEPMEEESMEEESMGEDMSEGTMSEEDEDELLMGRM